MKNVVALFTGLVFSLGLSLSGMTNPDRVLGFLDIFGSWDPALAFVLGGAVMVTVVMFRFVLKRTTPLLEKEFYLPVAEAIDVRLIAGAVIFGLGWGLYGYCPGPALAAISYLQPSNSLFVVSLVVGTLGARWWSARQHSASLLTVGQD
ncbi:MAG: YeeE/YedE family protein [Gammaproteobacteria bacterium]|nr:YeeE/YedE family protein [Gammaproteobacteria bacterium]